MKTPQPLLANLSFREKEIWNDGYATGLSDAGAIKAEFDLETFKDRLRGICTTDNETKAQFIYRIKSILDMDYDA